MVHSTCSPPAPSQVSSIVALHCDPRLDVGRVGLRNGTITAASDSVEVRVEGPGGHTARPHLTVDLVDVLARVVVGRADGLRPKVDGAPFQPSCGSVHPVRGRRPTSSRRPAGCAAVCARSTPLSGSEGRSWSPRSSTRDPHGRARATIDYRRGVPPVVNDPAVVDLLRAGITSTLGEAAVAPTEVSMGGEDFGWYLQSVPGALARLGVRSAGALGEPGGSLPRGFSADLHQATFDVDEKAIGVGVRVLVGTALAALA